MAEAVPPDASLTPASDVMNDPQYATNTHEEDGTGEPDTCRICRGEATNAEPLFYPCKCSGSIKFVHQDCLMEWLSHSQKKHCELCKTPFRFTKLYSPNMPQSLPFHVFFRQFVVHTAKNLVTWLRFCLVVTVWLGCLPWLIRQVWRVLFWFSDGGWPTRYMSTDSTRNSTTMQALEIARGYQQAFSTTNGTCPTTPLLAAQTTAASVGGLMDKLVAFVTPFSQTLNISSSDPLAAGLLKSLYYGMGAANGVVIPPDSVNNTDVSQFLRTISPAPQTPSLLSDVPWLKNLTRFSYANQLIISIMEGYIITILVVVSFILIFLIREWVVQQQPGINMGAGFNADFGGDRARALEEPQNPEPPQVIDEAPVDPPEARDPGQRFMARPRRRNVQFEEALQVELPDFRNALDQTQPLRLLARADEPAQQRPAMPARGSTEIPQMTEEFLNMWRRAGGDPAEVLRIIEREGLTERMQYWVKSLNKASASDSSNNGSTAPTENAHETGFNPILPDLSNSINSLAKQEESDGSNSEGWTDVKSPLEEMPNLVYPDTTSGIDKGKGKQTYLKSVYGPPPGLPQATAAGKKPSDENQSVVDPNTTTIDDKGKGKQVSPNLVVKLPPSELLPAAGSSSNWLGDIPASGSTTTPVAASGPFPFSAGTSRPRAISDGPHPREMSPLANNNWSFSNLVADDDQQPKEASPLANNSWSFSNLTASDDGSGTPMLQDENKNPNDFERQSLAWRTAQDLRVQQAFARGREAQQSIIQDHAPSVGLAIPMDPEDDPANYHGPIEVRGQDGVVRTHANWQAVFDSHPVENSDSEDNNPEEDQPNPFEPDTPLPEARAPLLARPIEQQAPQGVLEHVANWLWGGADDVRQPEEQGENDEHVVEDLAAEAPFVPVGNREIFDIGNRENGQQDREVVEAAIAAGLDPNDADVLDDAEDFEGIMELVGMRGPLLGLVQNALFSAFLLALTVAFGVWIPYNIGRISLLLVANPGPAFKLPLRVVFGCAAFLQDVGLILLGGISYCLVSVLSLPRSFYYLFRGLEVPNPAKAIEVGMDALRVSQAAVDRITNGTVDSIIHIADSELFAFSAASHEALLTIKSGVTDTLASIGSLVVFLVAGDYHVNFSSAYSVCSSLLGGASRFLLTIPTLLARPDSWVISLDIAKRIKPINPELSIWGDLDRLWAVVAGYSTLCLLGALYVRKGSPFSKGQVGREWEATVIDLLNQAGGVLKVILIISIEMLVFPLYCGLLLDVALLPLFQDATIMSRILFTCKSPLTSIFVHWFVGTCYMFHFALFVSMCRKIMRKGVLYFIRDPDDPTFHPVRDVLERNVAIQLRKILFSALVYGALVVICLGGVVWGLSFAFAGVLPIHWSSNEPVLEFPIDLLFYNFLMPLAVKFFKPSDGLHAMYSWWFRQCARMLRLTWFMFGTRQKDEEIPPVRRSWKELFQRTDSVRRTPLTDDSDDTFEENSEPRRPLGGKYVRAPASDQVRLPKGSKIFLEVDENNNRVDGKRDRPDGTHGRNPNLYTQVYIPPQFRLRICLFIILIWFFAAFTGVCITIVPLAFGRRIFAKIIPSDVRKNDVYAFAIGIYILGTALYAALHLRHGFNYLRGFFVFNSDTPKNVIRRLTHATNRVARVAWTWSAFLLFLPTLFAFVVEFYFILPAHTYFAWDDKHIMHFVQSWVLGLLYVKLASRLILWHEDSRPAIALRAVTRNGYFNPDARIATRSFILPSGLLLSILLGFPWLLASIAQMTVLKDASEKEIMLLYRYSYPMLLCLGLVCSASWALIGVVKGWRQKIKDEVYLIGERLHNFGDRKVSGASAGGTGVGQGVVRIIET